jgi:hypothetical protein
MDGDTNIKEQLASLQRDTGRIEGKLDAFIAVMSSNDKDIHDLEKKVGDIKDKQSYHTGFSAAVGSIGGFLLNWVIYHFR